ncbi:MAG: 5'-methylthioadenosine phosphorylase [Methanosphaera sp. rholeuAM270]|nr:MAG: 5'-methylthioadenosine phosphorylase [Methanosphaera sp. rholeuAM270]
MIGIIGGTGTASLLENYPVGREESVVTRYGKSPTISILEIENKEVAYIPRHSTGHSIPPHKINYRANIEALNIIGVKKVFATNSVGSLDGNIEPGDLLIPDNFIDFTHNRVSTFFDEDVVHIDCTEPYCENLRQILIGSGDVHPFGIYIATEGPRFETGAEIQFYKLIGGKVVGMTGVPEVVLAKEKQMCYSSICAVTNYAASISPNKLTVTEVVDAMNDCEEKLVQIITKSIKKTNEKLNCECQNTLNEAII